MVFLPVMIFWSANIDGHGRDFQEEEEEEDVVVVGDVLLDLHEVDLLDL